MVPKHLIAVVGGVASGKSTIAQYFLDTWPEVVEVIHADDYYKDRSHIPEHERGEGHINYDVPIAIDFELLHEHIVELKNGNSIPKITYDFKTKISSTTERIRPKPIVIVEGHQILCGLGKSPFDFAVFLDTPIDICFERRLIRDSVRRSKLDIAFQHIHFTLPAHNEYVVPQKELCDFISQNPEEVKAAIVMRCVLPIFSVYRS